MCNKLNRRFVVSVGAGEINIQDEVEFSNQKIEQNFSNYSAYHHRSTYLDLLPGESTVILEQEREMVRNAVFTEPDDQSAWIYYHYILSTAKLSSGAEAKKGIQLSQELAKVAISTDSAAAKDLAAYCETLQQEHDMCAELLEVEEDSKWALVTMAYILQLLAHRYILS
jgi:geranylgeranyl transferase type-2 subunit alpha